MHLQMSRAFPLSNVEYLFDALNSMSKISSSHVSVVVDGFSHFLFIFFCFVFRSFLIWLRCLKQKLRPSNRKRVVGMVDRDVKRKSKCSIYRSIFLKIGKRSSSIKRNAAKLKSEGSMYPKLINRTIAHSDKGTFGSMNKIYINISSVFFLYNFFFLSPFSIPKCMCLILICTLSIFQRSVYGSFFGKTNTKWD